MQFALNEDQIAVRDMAREFAAEKIAPHAIRWDEEKHFPVDVMREAATLGMGGVYIRDDVGGSALTRFDAALIFEALAQGCPTVSAFISIHNMASWMIDAYGNDTQRQKLSAKTLHHGAVGELLPDRAGLRLRRCCACAPARCATAIIMCSMARSSSFQAPARAISMW